MGRTHLHRFLRPIYGRAQAHARPASHQPLNITRAGARARGEGHEPNER